MTGNVRLEALLATTAINDLVGNITMLPKCRSMFWPNSLKNIKRL